MQLARVVTITLLVLCVSFGCSRFEKREVKPEFKVFSDMYKELNVYTEACLDLYKQDKINQQTADFFLQKIYETKLNLENILDILFFYKYADFINYENYQQIYQYVTMRMDSIVYSVSARKKFIENIEQNTDGPEIQDFCRRFAAYLHRINKQIATLKNKAK